MNKQLIIKEVIGVTIVAALIGLMVFLFSNTEATASVQARHWERVIHIEEYTTVVESDWFIPWGGRLLFTTWEFLHWEQEFSHFEWVTETWTESWWDGDELITETFSELVQEEVWVDVPVYATMYHYEIERWVWVRDELSYGTDTEPYWRDFALGYWERDVSTSELYKLEIIIHASENRSRGSQDTSFLSLRETEWNTFYVGQVIDVIVNRFGIVSLPRD